MEHTGKKVLIIGDSITEGILGINYVEMLQNNFQHIQFCNMGLGGDTLQGISDRLLTEISNIQSAETLCFDIEKEHRLDIHADYIFMTQVLLHINEVELVLSRLYDVLNEGGHLLIVDFDTNEEIVSDMVHNGFDQEKLADIMIKIGYRDIQSKTVYMGRKIFMGQDASLFILDSQK